MVKAMAAHKDFADKVDLQIQVAGPNAQRQIQQINAMVQQGAEAIVVYPISPTALNQVVKNACDKGVMIFAYDAEITEPCAYNVHDRPGRGRAGHRRMAGRQAGRQGQHRGHHRRARHLGRHAAHQGREGGLRQASRTSRSSAEAVGMWSQAVARTELSKILATHPWDEIDGLWMQVGCFTANSMQLEAGKTPDGAEALRRRRLERRPHPDAAGRHRGRGRQRHLSRRWARRASPTPRRPIPAAWR